MKKSSDKVKKMVLDFLKSIQDSNAGNIRLVPLTAEQKRKGVQLVRTGNIFRGVKYYHEESLPPLSSGKWQIQKAKNASDFTVKALDVKTEKRKVVISLEDYENDELLFSYYEDGEELEVWVMGEKVLDRTKNICNSESLIESVGDLMTRLE